MLAKLFVSSLQVEFNLLFIMGFLCLRLKMIMFGFEFFGLLDLSVLLNLAFSLLAFLFLVNAAKVLVVLSNALLLRLGGLCSPLFLALSTAVLVGTLAFEVAAAPTGVCCRREHV